MTAAAPDRIGTAAQKWAEFGLGCKEKFLMLKEFRID